MSLEWKGIVQKSTRRTQVARRITLSIRQTALHRRDNSKHREFTISFKSPKLHSLIALARNKIVPRGSGVGNDSAEIERREPFVFTQPQKPYKNESTYAQ
jgi:hypothetical protein